MTVLCVITFGAYMTIEAWAIEVWNAFVSIPSESQSPVDIASM